MSERIEFVAIRERNGTLWFLPAPQRHHDVIRHMQGKGIGAADTHDQGFVTDTGRYVDRREAMSIARAADQLIPRPRFSDRDELFSEDMW